MPNMIAGWLATAARRLRPGAGSLALEQVLALDPRRRLVVVRCHDRRVLLLLGGAQDLVVGWLDPATANPVTADWASAEAAP